MSLSWSLIRSSGYLASFRVVTNNLVVNLTPASYSGSGSVWDNTINNTDATLVNAPTYSNTQGFTLNGTNQYATVASVSSITDFTNGQNYTIEVWCYINATQNDTSAPDNCIVEKWNSSNQASYPYVLRYVRAGSVARFAVYNGSSNPSVSTTVGTNVWMQLACVFDHTNQLISMYVNGAFVTSSSLAITGFSNSSTLNIGRRANSVGGGTNYFTGRVGITRIYNAALTAAQLNQNYQANKAQFGLS